MLFTFTCKHDENKNSTLKDEQSFRARTFAYRTKYVQNLTNNKPTKKVKSPPPFNITLTKGAVHVIVRRDFVDYVINDVRAKTFLDWTKDTRE